MALHINEFIFCPTSQLFLVRPPTMPAIPAMTIYEKKIQLSIKKEPRGFF